MTDPFAALSSEIVAQSPLRAAITAATRRPEPESVIPLLEQASVTPDEARRVEALARGLVTRLRGKTRSGGVEGLIYEYSLSSQEGVALMCLAEALLRIPDAATRDALIRDKLSPGDWRAHVGHSPSLFVNAATWGLVLTGRLVATNSEQSLSAALTRLIARSGEPIIRKGVDVAMRLMGEQFVTGRTIEEAINASREREARGFTFSYDMLGEAATTADDAARYLAEYERAVQAIGKASHKRGIYEGPGISIKLSALHPRFSRIKRARVMSELLPRIKHLAALARSYDIGFNIDAEEADRLDLTLDLLEALCLDADLKGWNGLGFVVQAYGKRCPFVIDWLVDLARRSQRRLMVRLVKGAYWDSEIKRAQVDGLDGFPVFTRKIHSDVCYLASARRLLAAPDAVYPQFATHNAQTLASVLTMAGPNFYRGQYEFQCLHGMGEPLYEEVVGRDKLDRPCRVYAPVGSHETLLAYLVRRLLENGSNSSFVNRVADASVTVDELIADPVTQALAIRPLGAPHDRIALPRDLYGPERANSQGLDFSSEQRLAVLAERLKGTAREVRRAFPPGATPSERGEPVRNPADHSDIVGHTRHARADEIAAAIEAATTAAPAWAAVPPNERASILRRAADRLEAQTDDLVGLIVREAGKSYANAVAEVREAVDFLRYYASEAARTLSPGSPAPLGVVACISPWNFPLAIFTGQIAAALAAGNAVIAKPAEETPLIAAEAVRALHEAGVPTEALALLPGAGEVGSRIVADSRVQGVVFTGSTPVARLIEKELAGRLTRTGGPVPLIAETGGLNAMVVDSSALPEQVSADVMSSAFDSAGQRCSALRILCLQEDVADGMLDMLKGAMAELEVGDPRNLSVDVGPVITAEARDAIRRAYRDDARPRARCDAGEARRSGRQGNLRFPDPHRGQDSRRGRARGVRPGPACAALQARGARRADRFDQRRRLRPHLRPAYPHRRDDRAGRRADRGGQHLCQSQHHRRDGRRAAVRRLTALRHRPQGGRPALSHAAGDGASPGGARRARGRGRRARRASHLYRLAAPGRAPRGSRALRRPHVALAARRARRTGGAGRRAQRLCAPPPRPDRRGRDKPGRGAHPDRRHPRDRQRRDRQPRR